MADTAKYNIFDQFFSWQLDWPFFTINQCVMHNNLYDLHLQYGFAVKNAVNTCFKVYVDEAKVAAKSRKWKTEIENKF